MDSYSDLEISLRLQETGRYTADLSFRTEDGPAAAELDSDVPVALDRAALHAHALDPRAYGRALSDMLFGDARMREAWATATGIAAGMGARLRLRLRLDRDAPGLHDLHWETICDPRSQALLASSEMVLLSRYLDSPDLAGLSPPRRSSPRALVVAANPDGLQVYRLAEVNVAGELARARAALGSLEADVLGDGRRATLPNIVAALRERDDYEILFLVCHGSTVDGESYLWLENDRGKIQKVGGAEFAEALARLPAANRPGLVVLAACQGAGEAHAGAHAALGPRLARLGALAVLAMQGRVPMDTVERLMPAFFRELRADGRVDRALAVARGALGDDGAWWMPVLFMRVADGRLWEPPPAPAGPRPGVAQARVFISYKRHAEPDEGLALALFRALGAAGHAPFIDQTMTVGTNWRAEIEQQIERSDFLIVLLSGASAHSEMVTAEVEHALRHHRATGKAQVLPVRVAFDEQLPYRLAHFLDDLHYAEWRRHADTDGLVERILSAIAARRALPPPPVVDGRAAADPRLPLSEADPRFLDSLDDPGGAERLDSEFYVERDEDAALHRELHKRQGKTITIRASRQTGKTSLLVRGVQQLKERGAKVVHIDLQSIEENRLANLDSFLEWFARMTVRKLRLDQAEVDKAWRSGVGAPDKLCYLLEDYAIPAAGGRVVLAIDEADRVLNTPFHSDFFGMLRSWHNSRALSDVWDQLDILMVISTEPHLLIKDVSQSPFNVGTRLRLRDFTLHQVAELNRRYRSPLRDAQVSELFSFLGGHPYLTRKALYTIVCDKIHWDTLLAVATTVNSPFGDHLRRYYWLISGQPDLEAEVRHLLSRGACTSEEQYYRLFQAGLVAGVDARSCQFRCQLYEAFLREKLPV